MDASNYYTHKSPARILFNENNWEQKLKRKLKQPQSDISNVILKLKLLIEMYAMKIMNDCSKLDYFLQNQMLCLQYVNNNFNPQVIKKDLSLKIMLQVICGCILYPNYKTLWPLIFSCMAYINLRNNCCWHIEANFESLQQDKILTTNLKQQQN